MVREDLNVNWPGWEVIRRIGSGSFGTVYEIQRDVYGDIEKAALKVISIPHSEDEVDYLRCTGLNDASITQTFHQQVGDIAKEYKLMAQMRDNPNIVRCDDFRDIQHDDGLGWDIYIKMELLTPLMKCLDKVATEAEIIQLGKDICNALIVCQEKNIIHRDIKPQNVFVSEKGQFKLGDFGIARTIERTTQPTVGIGTYSYMAPEVKNNESYGKTADIYSLGLMLYWLLNERRGPFMPLPPAVPKYDDEEKARQRRFSGEQLPPPKHGSEELKSVVLKACAFDPEKRYQTALELMDALNSLQGSKTFAAVQPEFIKTEATEDIDGTVGPWKTVAEENPEIDEESGTVGPIFNGGYVEREKTQKEQVAEEKPPKKKRTIPIIVGVAVGFILFLLLLKSCGESEAEPTFPPFIAPSTSATTSLPDNTTVLTTAPDNTTVPTTVPNDTTVPTTVPNNTTAPTTVPNDTTVPTTAPTEPTHPQQTVWSGWLDELPDYVSDKYYLIEEKTFYSSNTTETTTSTTQNTMEGWELYDTVVGDGGFGNWSDWSETPVSATADRQVKTEVRYSYSNKETTTAATSSLQGWTLYNTTYSWGDYGSWSGWSTTPAYNSDSRQVETKTQYQYQTKWVETVYSDYGEWSEWSLDPVEEDELTQAESATLWGYYYFLCPNCGDHMHGYGTCWTWAGGCGRPLDVSTWHQIRSPISWDEAGLKDWHGTGKKYTYIDGELVFAWTNGDGDPVTGYHYRTRTATKVTHYSGWSEFSDTPVTPTSDREVKTRTVYKYCDRPQIPTYHFYRWGNWSSWSTNPVTATENRQVESKIFYQYCDRVTVTTYYFRRKTGWSEYTEDEIIPSELVEVKTKPMYRFMSKEN